MEYNRKITAKAPVRTTNHTFSHDFCKFICIFRNIFVPLRQILENCVVMATEQTQKEQDDPELLSADVQAIIRKDIRIRPTI